jgi:hypothetical protein
MKSQKESQCQKVKNWLKVPGRTLTRTQAYKKWGFHTLNSRVSDINQGKECRIKKDMVKSKSGARYAKYYML